uniref:Bidirectional sugar transporter SWEET n=1 Tax=Oryza rufipogon TaxID=4529 RepID=A0A0E0MT70_ORYRU
MVSNTIRVAVGILGNAASMLLYAAPILTFRRVIKKGSVEEFSCVPYILALFNCLLYTWYGLPVAYLMILFQKFVLRMVLPVLAFFALTAIFSSFLFHTHGLRKVFVGSIGLVASISMYSSPMVAASPNFIGCPMGILQLVLYCIYRKSHKEAEKLHDIDQENGLKVVTTHEKITGREPEAQRD